MGDHQPSETFKVLDNIRKLRSAGEFYAIDRYIQEIARGSYSKRTKIGLLMATFSYQSKLPNRHNIKQNVIDSLLSEYDPEVPNLEEATKLVNKYFKSEAKMTNEAHDFTGKGYEIHFQKGPVKEVGENGCQNEDLLNILIQRTRVLNESFPCRENSIAITKMEEALMWFERRTATRVTQGVEGHNLPHAS